MVVVVRHKHCAAGHQVWCLAYALRSVEQFYSHEIGTVLNMEVGKG